MAVNELRVNCELLEPVKIHYLPALFSASNNGNEISVSVTYNGEPVALSGSVKGYAVKEDGTTSSFNGSLSGNVATVTIPGSALMKGAILISVMLIEGIETTTIASISTSVI